MAHGISHRRHWTYNWLACLSTLLLTGRQTFAVTTSEAEHFLKEFWPPEDKQQLTDKFVDANVAQALATHNASAWAHQVPKDLFLDYVLPYASMDEERDGCRHMFQPLVEPLVANASSISEAALSVNRLLWSNMGGIYFKPNQTPDIMSPTQVVAAGYASCTGLSIFLVCALRSVGIPARVVGTPEWNTAQGGNHDWVEVWDGSWSFTGPTEYTSAGWNHTWFFPYPAKQQVPGGGDLAIYATSWRTTEEGHFPLEWASNNTWVNAYDVTQSYLTATKEQQVVPASR